MHDRQEANLAPILDRLVQAKTAQLPVHDDGYSLSELVSLTEARPNAWVHFIQVLNDLADSTSRNHDSIPAARQVAHKGGNSHLSHVYSITPVACSIRSAVIGRLYMRAPVAR